MGVVTTRKGFLGGFLSAGALGGCSSLGISAPPALLKFGVVSDIHVTTPESCAMFRRALAYFRRRGADAVVVAGDLADWGLRSGLRYVKEAWDAEMSGSGAVPLFITGNHDFDGWWYGDMTLDMHVQGYSEADALSRHGMKACWEEAFGESWAPFRTRVVKGFEFVSTEWGRENEAKAVEWAKSRAGEAAVRPMFFIRHQPLPGTTGDSGSGDTSLRDALAALPNCVSFTGHTHRTLNDERSIWQGGGLTAISVPSMSYTSLPGGYENGSGARDGSCISSMAKLPSRAKLLEAQGFFVVVRAGTMEVERYDFEERETAAPPWIVPMPLSCGRPYAFEEHAKRTPVPAFPSGAAVSVRTVNSERRNGRWSIFMELTFPAARSPGDGRVFDYEIRTVGESGETLAAKRFLSPAFYRARRHEQGEMSFLFDAMDVPETGEYNFHVVARNCFGAESAPLVSRAFRSVPGKTVPKHES